MRSIMIHNAFNYARGDQLLEKQRERLHWTLCYHITQFCFVIIKDIFTLPPLRSVMFLLYCAMKLFCALILVKVDLRFKTPAASLCHSVCHLLRSIEVLLLLLVVFISGEHIIGYKLSTSFMFSIL